jgi:hypothetical protein
MNMNQRIKQSVFGLLALVCLGLASTASAQVAVMPDRDQLSGTQVVVWGNTTHPNGTAFTLDFGDGSPVVAGFVADQSYIADTHTYNTPLPSQNFTATLTVGPDSATVTIRVINSSFLNAEQILDVQINQAIEDGLRSQYVNQTNRAANFAGGNFASWSGSSGSSDFTMAFTALALLAFENHGYNPASGTIYAEVVQRGLNFIFNNLVTVTLFDDGPGDPCAEIYSGANYGDPLAPGPNCTGLRPTNASRVGYSTSVVSLAIAGSGAPAALANHGAASGGFTVGKSYLEIVQRMVDAMAFAQFQGGWRYSFNQDNDGSTNGWNVLALLDGQAFGATVPGFVLGQLDIGTAALTLGDGSMGYTNKSSQNTAKTGIRLQALHLIGVALGGSPSAGGPTPQTSVDYINAGWKGRNEGFLCFGISPIPVAPFQTNTNGNNFGCLYAMFNVFKGLKLYGVPTLPNSSRADLDWHREYQDYLTQVQSSPTSITGGGWGNLSFSCCSSDTNGESALALLVLAESATILPDVLTFDLDLQEVVFGDTACLTVTAETTSGSPVPGVTITFDTQAGSLNHPLSLSDTTDASGVAQDCYSYDGSSGAGTDEWVASVGGVTSNSAFVDWISPNSPPDVSGAVPSVAYTSGPGKALIDISILGLSDPDGDALTVVITGITSDERTHRNGGDPAPDGFSVSAAETGGSTRSALPPRTALRLRFLAACLSRCLTTSRRQPIPARTR